ncbi:MAG: hypothetical protein H0V17_35895 [Deltaproteobacteria bacterium]|nr:hypothetical protein [Deltaproteobacteria bacterium]
MSQENKVVQLPAAGVPADQGLSSLGLIMQLAGSVGGLGVSLLAFASLLGMKDSRGDALWLFLLLSTCVVRSVFHRMAGTEMLYGRPGASNALGGLTRYIVIGAIHSVVFAAALGLKFDASTGTCIGLGLGLLVWPAVLGAMMATGLFSRFAAKVPVAEDKGFEGAAILMTVLGICGALTISMLLLGMVEAGGRAMREGRMVLIMLALIMLIARSILHAQAGISGLRTTSIDRSVELANRYSSFGIISAFCTGGAMLLAVMTTQLDVLMLAGVTGLTWMLMAWPMIIRRFFGDRQFNDLLAGEHADVHRRAPDAGLTGLGWLLLAHAAYCLTLLLPGLVGEDAPHKLFDILDGASGRSPWWNVGLAMFEGWAGYELIRMTRHHRIIALAYAAVASAVTLYLFWPALQQLDNIRISSPQHLFMLLPLALALVIPASVLVLVNRNIAPTARARVRFKPKS